MPTRRQRPRLRLTVPDDGGHEQVRVVERGTVRVRQCVAELATLMDRARRLRRDMAGDAAGERELTEQFPQPIRRPLDIAVYLGVGAVQIGVRDHPRSAVTWPGDVDGALPALPDDPVQVRVDEVQTRRRTPVAEQPRFDVVASERLPQQRVVEQVDLTHRQIVRGPPPGIDAAQGLLRNLTVCHRPSPPLSATRRQ